MDFTLLKPEIQAFINENIGADISKLALRKNPFPEENWIEILNQVSAKTKAKDKLPTWFSAENIIYPSKVSVEQTSSEKTALLKSALISGKTLIDLTGGFGVDDYYFARKMESVIHCEINPELSKIVSNNFKALSVENIQCICGDSTQILQDSEQQFDWIYIDPSRRNEAKGKVFMLKDCLPNVPDLLDFYFTKSDNILIKTAPILDITSGLSELKNVKTIHIVSVENEVKELNWELSKGYSGEIQIKTLNILPTEIQRFAFEMANPEKAKIELPKKYLYEPNSAIMKSGGFEQVAIQFQLAKLHQHSHLYTSDTKIDFPGRSFEIQMNLLYSKSEMKSFFENRKYNVTTRNFPETVEALRKKWKIKDGGNAYCFFTTDANNNKIALICSKI